MSSELRILIAGDAMGKPGRRALKKLLPAWKRDGRADFIIANGENSAHGKGLTVETVKEILDAGADVITGGNHVWDNKDVFKVVDVEPRLIRPANYPTGMDVPGRGYGIFECPSTGFQIGVMNLLGRVMMDPLECPFRTAKSIVSQIRQHTSIIIVDFHAEATSEKNALGWYLDGHVTCVFGTHTHIPTADERLLHHGTAYVTDIGMTGAYDSVIGMKYESVMDRFLRGMPTKFEVAEENVKMCGVLLTLDPMTGKALKIERVCEQAF